MANPYFSIAFTPSVQREQSRQGSRRAYANAELRDRDNAHLGPQEAEFIAARDGFYLATVNEDGWPYIQFRGGPPGFVKVLDDTRLAFADFRGNRQYLSAGNIAAQSKTSLFFMDYANQRRLKVFAEAKAIPLAEAGELTRLVDTGDDSASVERIVIFAVKAFDWNCPQHITPRYTIEEISRMADAAG
ncbi:MAG: pyridoxamine 5'-phosphate oxidase family protein [Betaproteobacteria bacterium]|nr:pyridoxamine 5'-phosphate oxidase family protein [Betaproteobacteria bacterium]